MKDQKIKFLASSNFNARPEGMSVNYIVLHYTVLEAQEALAKMCDPASEVSAHYMIDRDGTITQLVNENNRAWHAGVSLWKGQNDINSRSIGIELVNDGQEPFPKAQINALIKLVREIMARHRLKRPCLLAHSDIAPTRKTDPGIFFPWQDLANEGLDFFPSPDASDDEATREDNVKELLQIIGYDVTDEKAALAAFQRRYRPKKIDGEADAQTLCCLRCLQQAYSIASGR